MKPKTAQEIQTINTDDLKLLAVYLEGIKQGKGNLLPLGTIVLETLWNTIAYLQGSPLYKSYRDEKVKH